LPRHNAPDADPTAQPEKGQAVPLENYKGKVTLIVNTASKCGFTPQYEGLEKLYKSVKEKHGSSSPPPHIPQFHPLPFNSSLIRKQHYHMCEASLTLDLQATISPSSASPATNSADKSQAPTKRSNRSAS
jgi:hypothetical protein